jgi:hypothetical protein
MEPLFAVRAFGVLAHEEVVSPLLIGQGIGIQRAGNVGFTATTEFAFSSRAAPGAGNVQHLVLLVLLMGYASRTMFVNQVAGRETIEGKGCIQGMWLVLRHGVRHDPA